MILLIICALLYRDDDPFFVWYRGGKNRAPIMIKSVTPTQQETDQMKRDMRKIKELGFSSIKFWVIWSHPERQPINFSLGALKTLLQLAYQEQLRALIQLYAD
jgi:hypothetical protein